MYNKKSILLGDYTHPKFHPLQGVDAQISYILNEVISVQCSENKNLLLLEHLKPFDLCICYFDLWDDQVSKQQTSGLLSYVSQGEVCWCFITACRWGTAVMSWLS